MNRANPEPMRCSYCDQRCAHGRHVEVHEQDCEFNPANVIRVDISAAQSCRDDTRFEAEAEAREEAEL